MFNVRVYGLLINKQNELLVADEYIKGGYYTKFPGGGLEFGEGTRDCLKREFQEELNAAVEIGDHFYTTDFFQMSAFSQTQQIISIYYLVQLLEPLSCNINIEPFQYNDQQLALYEKTMCIESFRYIPLTVLTPHDVTLPIDKVVVNMLLQQSS